MTNELEELVEFVRNLRNTKNITKVKNLLVFVTRKEESILKLNEELIENIMLFKGSTSIPGHKEVILELQSTITNLKRKNLSLENTITVAKRDLKNLQEEMEDLQEKHDKEIEEAKDELKDNDEYWEEKWKNRDTLTELLQEESYDPYIPTSILDEQRVEILKKMYKHLSLKDFEQIEKDYLLVEKI